MQRRGLLEKKQETIPFLPLVSNMKVFLTIQDKAIPCFLTYETRNPTATNNMHKTAALLYFDLIRFSQNTVPKLKEYQMDYLSFWQ